MKVTLYVYTTLQFGFHISERKKKIQEFPSQTLGPKFEIIKP